MTEQRNVLILFAHPNYKSSRVCKALRKAVENFPGVTLRDLYAHYPSGIIDVEMEKSLLLEHSLIVFQHPFYWYSSPSLLKQWQDDVLEFGWAYGEGGDKLKGKMLWSVITTGGPEQAYHPEGYNRFEMSTLLSPFNQTAHLCQMNYLTPHILHGVMRFSDEQLKLEANRYSQKIQSYLSQGVLP
jgi:glutathione-regulated potassium-efflux system ancillary protein KefG